MTIRTWPSYYNQFNNEYQNLSIEAKVLNTNVLITNKNLSVKMHVRFLPHPSINTIYQTFHKLRQYVKGKNLTKGLDRQNEGKALNSQRFDKVCINSRMLQKLSEWKN